MVISTSVSISGVGRMFDSTIARDDDPESRDHFNAQVLAPFLFSVGLKTESIRKSSNFNFQWTRTLYQNNLNNIYMSPSFLHFSRAIDVISYL